MMTSLPLASLGLTYPIFQAPIGSVASPELASAVSNAGGLGHLACTWRSPEQLATLFKRMRTLTERPYGANFVLGFPIEERLAVAPLPVLAAGGIADHRGVAAARALGAAGVWVGTRFLGATEANIHEHYQMRVLSATGDDTLHSELFDIGWPEAPLRTLKNSTTLRWETAGRPLRPNRPGEGDIVARRTDGSEIPRYFFGSPTREIAEGAEAMALYAGEAVGLVSAVAPAALIVLGLAVGPPERSQ
jgi:NAD(P)H-dependent flavin oxidoreductase YrpB (nitropropane dioxygenase family)